MIKFFITLLLINTAFAQDISIQNAYVRMMPKSSQVSAAFMKIINKSNKKVGLIKAHADISKTVEVHNHIMVNGVMKMMEVPSIDLPTNKIVDLRPGSFHIMLIGLKRDLVMNEKIKFQFDFSNGEKIQLELPVQIEAPAN